MILKQNMNNYRNWNKTNAPLSIYRILFDMFLHFIDYLSSLTLILYYRYIVYYHQFLFFLIPQRACRL